MTMLSLPPCYLPTTVPDVSQKPEALASRRPKDANMSGWLAVIGAQQLAAEVELALGLVAWKA